MDEADWAIKGSLKPNYTHLKLLFPWRVAGLKVAIKCKSGADGTYETKALAPLDDTGAFSIPLAAELLRGNGELERDCFAQLHTAPDTPCDGQAPPRIAPAGLGQDGNTTTTTGGAVYLAAAADTVFGPVECACGKFKKKKHFMFGPPPPPPKPDAPKPPTPTPTYGPPTPTPAPVPKPPAPEEPEPFFHKHPKMKKFMHKKKPCPPLIVDDDTTRSATRGQEKVPKKLN